MLKRPIFVLGAAYFAGALAAGVRPWHYTYAILIFVPVCCLIYCVAALARGGESYSVSALIIISVLTSLSPVIGYTACVSVWKERIGALSEHDGKTLEMRVVISSQIETRDDGSLLVEADVQDRKGCRILLNINESHIAKPLLSYGGTITISGKLKKPMPPTNEFAFDNEKHLYSRGLSATLFADGTGIAKPTGFEGGVISPISVGILIRERIAGVFGKVLPKNEAALLSAILLGGSEGLDSEGKKNFETAGLLHIMAVSGLHVVISAELIKKLLKKLGFGIKAAYIGSVVLVVVYIFVAGFSASIIRASMTYGFSVLAKLIGRPYDSLNAAGLAALVLLINNPMVALSAGFILSFSTVVSILTLSPIIKSILTASHMPKWLAGAFSIPAAVSIGCFPVQAALFGQYAVYSILVNVVVSPIVTGILALGQIIAFTGSVFVWLAQPFAYVAVNLLSAIAKIAEVTANLPGALLTVAAFTPPRFTLYYIGLVTLFLAIKSVRHIRYKAFGSILGSVVIVVACTGVSLPSTAGMEIVFLDVGNANATYINVDGDRHIVVDAGGTINYSGAKNAAETRLAEYLKLRGVSRVDVAIATHGDNDHIGGFDAIFDEIPVSRLVVSATPDEKLQSLIKTAAALGTEVIFCAAGDYIDFGRRKNDAAAVIIEALTPERTSARTHGHEQKLALLSDQSDYFVPFGADANDLSLVTRVRYGEMSALFCGDIGFDIEETMLKRFGSSLESKLISVPHHGSKYSSGDKFIDAVNPTLAIIGVGKNNYGHPAPDVIKRYAERGSDVRRTDKNGTVSVFCDRYGITGFKCYNDISNQYAWRMTEK